MTEGQSGWLNYALALKASIPIPLARASYRTTSNLGVGKDRNANYIAPEMGWEIWKYLINCTSNYHSIEL